MTTESVLDHHLDAFTAQDLDECLVDYTDDSVIITNMGTFRGLDEIEELFAGLFEEFSQAGSTIELDQTSTPTSSGTGRPRTTTTSSVRTRSSSRTT
mgnify:CR=1 FL=1